MSDHFKSHYLDIVELFDKDATSGQFLREDGEGGFRAGVYRMAREIDRLREKCGEPPERDQNWEAIEDAKIDADITAITKTERYKRAAALADAKERERSDKNG